MTKILDPVTARSKGRPPSKKKASKVDQIVKRKLAGKKGQKSNTCQSQEEVILKFSSLFYLFTRNKMYV